MRMNGGNLVRRLLDSFAKEGEVGGKVAERRFVVKVYSRCTALIR